MASGSISCNGVRQRCLRTGCYWKEQKKRETDGEIGARGIQRIRGVGREELKRHVEEEQFVWMGNCREAINSPRPCGSL